MRLKKTDKEQHEFILNFLQSTPVNEQCDISRSIKATISQFINNFGVELMRFAKIKDGSADLSCSNVEILQAQINVLRECIIDLEEVKNVLVNGITKQ